MQQEAWWKKSVIYQIYPKSFKDTTGNGVGDINGIIEKLDYLVELGVDVLWLTPIYTSPERDNGYDIADYYSINPNYGDMAAVEQLLEESHQRGLKIIMDIVVNHTSTEHEWFKQARSAKDSPYRDFYIWKDPVDGGLPNNWQSKFGGPAWEYDEETGQYYLHLFDVTQADLNWENEQVREEVYQMMNFWLKKGVDGFRLDVINLISKDQSYTNDDGSVVPGDGRKFYTDGPRIHEYLHKMNKEVFAKHEAMTVGEMSSTSIDECIQYTNPRHEELDMVFSFHHLKVDYPNGEKWAKADFDLQQLKQILSNWQVQMHEGGGWNALFWCNHDQPRVVSRFGNDVKYHKESAKMLATTIHMMQGTPYIYQGEEIGMKNPYFQDIEDYRDVESLNMYNILSEQGHDHKTIIDILQQKSRDNSRTPMHWNVDKNGGFTTGTPWIGLGDYEKVNVESALREKDSIFYHYQRLNKLRKKYDIITYGDYQLILADHEQVFAYVRQWNGEKLLVLNNFYDQTITLPSFKEMTEGKTTDILIANYADAPIELAEITLRPYESVVYHMKTTK
ncbi:alpha,alpha-phosphotrehalase [Virgibacillus salexigens]|uniref:alpha,alpha-phosphotrehalase n=1 Tax=Virgibacillus salexigens TaxID=61016 RepID=UPI00190B484A|nr:alpha,alpha-phosphotrehalase [Virgibacillus salexigens]